MPVIGPIIALVTALLIGCATPEVASDPTPLMVATRATLSVCDFAGTWRGGMLRAPRGGFELGLVRGGAARGSLDRHDGPLRFHMQVSSNGWHLAGRLDPERDEGPRLRRPTWLIEGVGMGLGAWVQVADARPGEVRVALAPLTRTDRSLRWIESPTRWLPCSALAFDQPPERDGSPAGERRALGIHDEPSGRAQLNATEHASLSHRPGGPAFVEISPRERPLLLTTFDQQGAWTRVVWTHWTSALITGWIATETLSYDLDVPGGLSLPDPPDRGTPDVCSSSERLQVYASAEGSPPEPIGVIDPGTRFVRHGALEDGSVSIEPHPGAGVTRRREGVIWHVSGSASLSCERERLRPVDPLLGDPVLALQGAVTSSTLDGVPVGSACAFEVRQRSLRRSTCRASVRCGDRIIYGASDTSGFFPCEVSRDDPPSVRGTDQRTSQSDRDPALALDTRAGTLTVEDDAEGALGAFRLEARIERVELIE